MQWVMYTVMRCAILYKQEKARYTLHVHVPFSHINACGFHPLHPSHWHFKNTDQAQCAF